MSAKSGSSFIGSGWAFPMRFDAAGSVALVSFDTEIRESIHLILGTSVGERPMRPEFGCRIHDHVFGVADATTAGLIAADVRRALHRWEPRIELDEVDVTIDPADRSCLWIDINYRISGTNDPRNLVFPFYVIPGEAT
jgi:phage baseplate assembly protein W